MKKKKTFVFFIILAMLVISLILLAWAYETTKAGEKPSLASKA